MKKLITLLVVLLYISCGKDPMDDIAIQPTATPPALIAKIESDINKDLNGDGDLVDEVESSDGGSTWTLVKDNCGTEITAKYNDILRFLAGLVTIESWQISKRTDKQRDGYVTKEQYDNYEVGQCVQGIHYTEIYAPEGADYVNYIFLEPSSGNIVDGWYEQRGWRNTLKGGATDDLNNDGRWNLTMIDGQTKNNQEPLFEGSRGYIGYSIYLVENGKITRGLQIDTHQSLRGLGTEEEFYSESNTKKISERNTPAQHGANLQGFSHEVKYVSDSLLTYTHRDHQREGGLAFENEYVMLKVSPAQFILEGVGNVYAGEDDWTVDVAGVNPPEFGIYQYPFTFKLYKHSASSDNIFLEVQRAGDGSTNISNNPSGSQNIGFAIPKGTIYYRQKLATSSGAIDYNPLTYNDLEWYNDFNLIYQEINGGNYKLPKYAKAMAFHEADLNGSVLSPNGRAATYINWKGVKHSTTGGVWRKIDQDILDGTNSVVGVELLERTYSSISIRVPANHKKWRVQRRQGERDQFGVLRYDIVYTSKSTSDYGYGYTIPQEYNIPLSTACNGHCPETYRMVLQIEENGEWTDAEIIGTWDNPYF